MWWHYCDQVTSPFKSLHRLPTNLNIKSSLLFVGYKPPPLIASKWLALVSLCSLELGLWAFCSTNRKWVPYPRFALKVGRIPGKFPRISVYMNSMSQHHPGSSCDAGRKYQWSAGKICSPGPSPESRCQDRGPGWPPRPEPKNSLGYLRDPSCWFEVFLVAGTQKVQATDRNLAC